MDEEEIKEWSNVLLDLVNKVLVEIVVDEKGEQKFRIIIFFVVYLVSTFYSIAVLDVPL